MFWREEEARGPLWSPLGLSPIYGAAYGSTLYSGGTTATSSDPCAQDLYSQACKEYQAADQAVDFYGQYLRGEIPSRVALDQRVAKHGLKSEILAWFREFDLYRKWGFDYREALKHPRGTLKDAIALSANVMKSSPEMRKLALIVEDRANIPYNETMSSNAEMNRAIAVMTQLNRDLQGNIERLT